MSATAPSARPPQAARRPERRCIGGYEYTDDYAWLEADDSQVQAWQRAQTAFADAELERLGIGELAKELAPLCAASAVFAPQRFGDVWIRLAISVDGLVVLAGEDLAHIDRVVCNPAQLLGHGHSLDYCFPSPSGRWLAIGTSCGGDEQSHLRILDTVSGRLLAREVRYTSNTVVAWLPDESGLFCSAGERSDFECVEKHLLFVPRDDALPVRQESASVRQQYSIRPQVSDCGRWLAAMTSELEPRPDLIRELPDGPWRPFLVDVPGACYGVFVGDVYVAICNADASHGRLMAIPLATAADRRTWRELVAEGPRVLRSIEKAGDRLVLCSYEDSFARLTVLAADGAIDHEVALPGDGVVRTLGLLQHYQLFGYGGDNVAPGQGEITFTFATMTTAPATYRYELATRRLTRLDPPRMEHPGFSHRRETAVASDGAAVRYSLVHRQDLDRTRPQPTLMFAYGGFNVSFIPGYLGVFAHFVEAGGILAFCQIRGGAEFGADQWRAGRLAAKEGSWTDLIAIADRLLASGVCTADRLAVYGASGGGMLAAGAIARRPELWCAAAIVVPLTDLLQFTRDPYAGQIVLDLGDPADRNAVHWLRELSPYHALRESSLPAALVMAGANDMRTRPWHARKFAARLQACQTGERPLLLRVEEGVGHMGTTGDPWRAAVWLGFIEAELGLRARR